MGAGILVTHTFEHQAAVKVKENRIWVHKLVVLAEAALDGTTRTYHAIVLAILDGCVVWNARPVKMERENKDWSSEIGH